MNMQLFSLTVITLFIVSIHASYYGGITTEDRRSSPSGSNHPNANTTASHAMLKGSNPLNLTILSPVNFTGNTGPYTDLYPSANLHYNGVWYPSTYGASENGGPCANWCVQGPFLLFRYSVDQGKIWYVYNLHPTNDTENLFNQTSAKREKVKFCGLHLVDLSKNQEWSQDGYVYLIGHESNSSFPVESSIQSVNGVEYIRDGVEKAQPLFVHPDKTGAVTASYVPALK